MTGTEQKQRPNILWLCTDQQRYDTVACLGNPHIRTPNIDRLCAEGTAFTRTYCQSPICTPSRSSFLTGLYPSSVHGNINGNLNFNLPENAQLISQHLSNLGYTCGLSGKLHLSSAWNGVENRLDDGYQVFNYSHASTQGTETSNQYMGWLAEIGKFDEVMDQSNRNDRLQTGIKYRENIPFELHQTTWCTDRALAFMRENESDPWFFSWNVFDPHGPFDAPADFSAPYESADLPAPLFHENDLELQENLSRTHVVQGKRRRPGPEAMKAKASYYGMVELIDRNVGRLIDYLEETGQRENTVIIFTSDHGEMLGDHGLMGKGCRFYEGLTRVPLVISWPGQVEKGLQSDALVELLDIVPTLTEIVDEPMAWTQGKSLWPIISGQQQPDHHHDFVRCEFYDVLDMKWGKEGQNDPPSYATMYRNDRYKLVVYHGSEYGELYDLEQDPDEFNNLWFDDAKSKVRMQLLKDSFDASMVIVDPGSTRIGRF